MFNVCHRCGAYHADKIIDPAGPYAVCPACGFPHPFQQLPLFIVSGASGAGKTSVCQHITGMVKDVVPLDQDILWGPAFDQPETNYRDFFETWLRLCKNIGQSGRPVVLFGAGAGVPANIEPCVERRYFTTVHYLALVCADEVLVERLSRRPAWRASSDPAFVESQVQFNRWFKTQAPAITLLDTTAATVPETNARVVEWIAVHRKQDQDL